MPSYAIDSKRQPMTATGIVEPVFEWEEMPDGRRRPSETQARNEATGMPLWQVEVLYTQVVFGRRSTATAMVTVDAEEEPKPRDLSPIGFVGLRAEVRVNKAGGITEYWNAESVLLPSSANKPTGTGNPSDKAAA